MAVASTLAYGAIAALSPAQRRKAEAQLHGGTLERLTEALTMWMRGAHFDTATFADRFFGRDVDDPSNCLFSEQPYAFR